MFTSWVWSLRKALYPYLRNSLSSLLLLRQFAAPLPKQNRVWVQLLQRFFLAATGTSFSCLFNAPTAGKQDHVICCPARSHPGLPGYHVSIERQTRGGSSSTFDVMCCWCFLSLNSLSSGVYTQIMLSSLVLALIFF